MRYTINRDHYHRFDVLEKNKLPARSYFIPFADRDQADKAAALTKRYLSTKVTCLNGQWDFRFYPRPAEIPHVLDTQSVEFDSLDVPSCWQFRGYCKPFYLNTRYQFPYTPPKIPAEEPVGAVFSLGGSDLGIKPRVQTPEGEYNYAGIYRRKFQIANSGKKYVISFLGVASCLDLYVNGSFAGYSEGSHNTAEFDLTGYVQPGENELVAVVRRWSTGSYLECQDMFRNNGIFRDVLLYEMEPSDLWDFTVHQQKSGEHYSLETEIALWTDSTVTITLQGHGIHETRTAPTTNGRVKITMAGLQVREWNAEEPVLYDLYIELPGTCVKHRIGFREVKIQGDVFMLNGRKLKLRGVNHHDTSCTAGYYLTPQEIFRDVRLCKEYNIDTIRTSHYPPDPLLPELCDELGIYLVDEADLETHGTFTMQFPPSYNSISHDSKWQPRYLDRVQRLYGRDKNHSCVLMWSLGNEAGGYQNTDAMYQWLRQQSPLPIHYESVIHSSRICYDVGSEMYPRLEKVAQVAEHRRREKPLNNRPYFLCEYAHAMGVGPGAMEEYWQLIYAHENLMGGCVWEMVDHAVLHSDGSYTYGGDHGEWAHDSNFCVDGLFYPDRTPSTGAKIVRHVYRPIRVRHIEENRYEIFNTTAFTEGSGFTLRFCYPDGKAVTIQPDVPPMTRQVLDLPECAPQGESLTVIAHDRHGREVSREQILFTQPRLLQPKRLPGRPAGVDVVDGKVVITKDGKRLSCGPQHTLLFRAPTDNDRDFALKTAMDDYVVQKEELVSVVVEANRIVVKNRIQCRRQSFLCTDIYENSEQGILVTSRLQCLKGRGDLPRFAKLFRLDESFSWVEYVGRNQESYCDMKDHAQIQKVCCTVSDMTEPNIKPQESGNRCDCSFACISDGETGFSFTAVEKPFELGVKPYSDWELLSMRHRSDEVCTGTYVAISAFQMGIGTGSCGPATLKKYRYSAKETYTLQFVIQ